MSGAEILGIISAVISTVDATIKVYNAAKDEAGLPPNFKTVSTKLPLVSKLLEDAERYVDGEADNALTATFTPVLTDCEEKATQLQQLFEKVIPTEGNSRMERYFKAARTIGKGGRVEALMKGILDNLQLLTAKFPEAMSLRGQANLEEAIEEVKELEPSLPEGFEDAPSFAHYGSGAQNVNTGLGSQYNNNSTGNQNNGPGNQFIGTNHIDCSNDHIAFGDKNFGIQAKVINLLPTQQRSETPPKPSIMVPFQRDRSFVKREVMNDIEQKCGQPGSRAALVGFGGVGKSQLAIEYTYRIEERFPGTWVFWIHASNRARFEKGFQNIATTVKVPGRQNPKADILQLVHDWLRDKRHGPWIVVLDNVDDASFLKLVNTDIEAATTTIDSASQIRLISYIPYCHHGSVLITSRSRNAALQLVDTANIISIEPMKEEDAVQLFRNKLGHCDSEVCTSELAEALDFMPLAIAQAAAYVVQRRPRYSLQNYLDDFRKSNKRRASLLGLRDGKLRQDADKRILGLTGEEFRRDDEAKNSILLTWQISFDYIRKTRTSAAELLSLMSFCDRQGIPESLLRNNSHSRHDAKQKQYGGTKNAGGGIGLGNNTAIIDEGIDDNSSDDSDWTEKQSTYSDDDIFDNDIATLRDFSFITPGKDEASFEMHRLVQVATLEWLKSQGSYEKWQHQFLARLSAEMPSGEYENWDKCQALFPHAVLVSAQRPTTTDSLKEWATILHRAAWFAVRKGKGIDAEELSVQAMKARKRIFEKDHDDILWSTAMVALAYSVRGRWSEAEKLEVQVMETRKAKLGPDHPDTLTGMANLASTYMDQGRWDEAEKLGQIILTR
ncbi:hypothetical protein NLG97_g3419 [Lecanicillium saksenae]|uniref:Uncharacterized protein n=1 Tax=Lecanicillium saksenae TaxID=468837 RepID=A0ACC1R249_9HYPO|nr:hypothetical protein NLG97_g3419 [Lecanicillium saksenae]